jgi:hypothetical protein
MRRKSGKDIGEIFAEGTPIDEALRRGVREAIRQHRLAGVPMVVWRDGRIVHIPAEQLERELEELERADPTPDGEPGRG